MALYFTDFGSVSIVTVTSSGPYPPAFPPSVHKLLACDLSLNPQGEGKNGSERALSL